MNRASLCVLIMVIVAIPTGKALAGYSGSLISASADSPMVLGNSLDYTVTVQNTGSDDWWDEWVARVDSTSWSVPWSYMDSYCYDYPSAGEFSTNTFHLGASNLPSSAGSYSFNVRTYTWDDWGDGFWMTNIPQTVNFSMVENQSPIADLTGDVALPTPDDGYYEAYPVGHADRHAWVDGDKSRINDWWAYIADGFYKVTLDASDSSDPDGSIVSWDWAIDPSGLNYTATGETVDVFLDTLLGTGFQEYQTYELKLTVGDDLGATDIALGQLTVLPEPATLSLLAVGLGVLLRGRRKSGPKS